MEIKIKHLHHRAITPTYATDGSVCFDLYAATVNGNSHLGDVVYEGHPVTCDIGIAFEVPPGHILKIEPRSGLKFNHGVEAFSGTIDSDYRGGVQVILTAHQADEDEPPLRINPGDRIAQAWIAQAPRCTFVAVDHLSSTARGAGGFGSTGS